MNTWMSEKDMLGNNTTGGWDSLKSILEKAKRKAYREALEEERELVEPSEIEAWVNRELFDEFAKNAREMALVGECYTERNVESWRRAGIKRISYFGPKIRSYPSNDTNSSKMIEYNGLDLDKKIGKSYHGKYNVVASLMTVQYYFETESAGRLFFQNVASLLAPGGHFICTYYDGSVISTQMQSHGGINGVIHPDVTLSIEKAWVNPVKLFGSAYITNRSEVRQAYLVFTNILLTLGKKAGLTALSEMPDEMMLYMNEHKNEQYHAFHYYDSVMKNVIVFRKD